MQAPAARAELGTSSCDLYASTAGSDRASGSLEHPFATVAHLVATLSPGQTGCVRGGTYTENVRIERSGTSAAPITITSFPGERATLVGRLWLHQGADYVTVENMNLNGRNSSSLPSPNVNGNNDQFLGNDVTDEHTEICFVVGSTWGRANHTLIQGNRIHDCGMIPSRNQDHGIYVDEADNTQILDNVIYDNTDRGVQLYPDAQGTVIERNIIDSNGEGILFGGSSGSASSNTTVKDNLITNAQIRYDLESWYPSGNPSGQNNVAQDNCVWGGAYGTIQSASAGFQASANITANPTYANAAQGDYRVASGSPCAQLLSPNTIPTEPFTTTSTTTYGSEPTPPSEPAPPTPPSEPVPPSKPTEPAPPSTPTETTPPPGGGTSGGGGSETTETQPSPPPPTTSGGGSRHHGGHHSGHRSTSTVSSTSKRHRTVKAHIARRHRASIARRAKRH
jgi:parallel beta-helix repeat protein